MTTNTVATNIATVDLGSAIGVRLEVHIWSGRKTLSKDDLVHANPEFRKLPEKELANLGSVKICDPAKIKRFRTFRNKARGILARNGVPFMGGWAIPKDRWPKVRQELLALQAEYRLLVTEFVKNFDVAMEAWKTKHLMANPEWAVLFTKLPTATSVGGKLDFLFHPQRFMAPSDDPDSELNAEFNAETGGLRGELLRKVAAEAMDFVKSLTKENKKTGVVSERQFVTPKTLGPLTRAAVELKAFTFLDPSLEHASRLISDAVDSLEGKKRVDGRDLLMLSGLARMLSSSDGVSQLIRVAQDGGDASQAVHPQMVGSQLSGAELHEIDVVPKATIVQVSAPTISGVQVPATAAPTLTPQVKELSDALSNLF